MRSRPILRLEEKIEGESALLLALGRTSERRHGVVAAAIAAAGLALVAALPRPSGAAAATVAAAPTGSWVSVVRGMPPAPPAPTSAPSPAPPPSASPEPISLEAFRDPEPIPEPATAAFLPSVPPPEPEAPLGTPEPPPEPREAAAVEAPPVETVPPRVAPGGKVPPKYPIAARSLRLSGTVKLEVEVDASGAAVAVRVLSTDRAGVGFEEAATRAVERWRFVPATRGLVPVPGTTEVQVEFRW